MVCETNAEPYGGPPPHCVAMAYEEVLNPVSPLPYV